jgi:hypothetical protein
VLPASSRTIGHKVSDGSWVADHSAQTVTVDGLDRTNAAVAAAAISWFAGSDDGIVGPLNFGMPDTRPPIGGPGWPRLGPLGTPDRDWSVAMQCAGLATGENDWRPLPIGSTVDSGVRVAVTEHGPVLQISFESLTSAGVDRANDLGLRLSSDSFTSESGAAPAPPVEAEEHERADRGEGIG